MRLRKTTKTRKRDVLVFRAVQLAADLCGDLLGTALEPRDGDMRIWPALLLGPLLALINLSIPYALVMPECMRQADIALHMVVVVSLLLVLLFVGLAWQARRERELAPKAEDASAQSPHFLATVAVMVGAFSAVLIIAQWIPQWIL